LAADQRLHDVHARQLGQRVEPRALGDGVPDGSRHGPHRLAAELHSGRQALSNRYGNALVVGGITALGDAYSHPNHYGFLHAEALLTGAVSALLAVLGSYLLEDRGRRVRTAWSMLVARSRRANE
jgi:hypothetical protein